MADLTIVGLGPGDPDLRTLASQRALDAAGRIILRTGVHPGVEDLLADPRVTTCDDLYERLPTFDAVYAAIADRVFAALAGGPVVFAVPGHPRFGERSVAEICARAAESDTSVAVLDGVSACDVVFSALGVDPLADDVQIVDGVALGAIVEREPYAGGLLAVDPSRPCLVTQVYGPPTASAVKLALSRLYPDDHQVTLVTAARVPGEEVVRACALHALDRQAVNHLTSVWIPALAPLEATRDPATLQRIVGRLRAPGGCPWDREQMHASLRDALLEEAYEVVDAIDRADTENLAEELGDLLLLVVMHAQIAEEQGDFALEDVYDRVARKLVRRHPHVFAEIEATTADAVVATWNAVKAEERRARGEEHREPDLLDRLPRAMPALLRAAAVVAARPYEGGIAGDGGVGERLLTAVEEAVRAGLNPETELEAALRRRAARPVAPGQEMATT